MTADRTGIVYNASILEHFHIVLFGLLTGLLATALIPILDSSQSGEPIIITPPATLTLNSITLPTTTPAPWRLCVSSSVKRPRLYQIPSGERGGMHELS